MSKALLGLVFLFSMNSFGEKVFVYCSEASPSTFNPQLASDGPTFNASSSTVFNRLIEFQYGKTELEPGLAETWSISKDGKTYTFNLRKKVAFHTNFGFTPSRTLNADDVVFSFDRMKNPKNPFHKVSGGTYEYFKSIGMGDLIESVEKVDEFTVNFKLTRPHAPFLTDLASSFAVIHSKEYADLKLKEKKLEAVDREPIGTGPFQLVRYSKDSSIRYKSHKGYFLGAPKLDQLVFAITPDASVRYQKLKTGECHLIAEPAPTDLEGMKKLKSLRVLSEPGLNVGYLAFNVLKKPLDNGDVRRAIGMALNREQYLKLIYLNTATLAKNPIPPTLWGYETTTKAVPYDVEGAKALLAKAGFKDGFDLELWTLPVSRPYNPNGKKMGELMQADLAKVGIRLKLMTFDWPTYLDKGRKAEHQMIHLGWISDTGDPDNFFSNLLTCKAKEGGSNYAQWCNPEFDKFVLEAQKVTDKTKRTASYKKAQAVFSKELPWIPLAHASVFRAVSTKVVGYKINPIGVEEFYPLDLN